MPNYNAGDTIEVHLLSRTNGVLSKNVIYFEVKQTMVIAATLSIQIQNQYCGILRGTMSNRGEFYGIISRRLLPTPVTEYQTEIFSAVQGGVTSNMTTEALSSIVVLKHGLGTIARTGRMYVPFPPLGAYLNGGMDTAHISRMQDCVAALKAQFSTTGSNAWLRQLIRGKVPGGFVYRPVVDYTWRAFLGIQRKRRRGFGA